jgi:hypothetical protein
LGRAVRLVGKNPLHDALDHIRWRPGKPIWRAFLGSRDGGEREDVLCTPRAEQSKSTKPQDALQACEAHLDPLALVLLAQCLRYRRTTGQRLAHAHGCRAGSCEMAAGTDRGRACLRDTEAACPHEPCRSSRAAFRPGSGRGRLSDYIEVATREGALSITGTCCAMPSPRPTNSASAPPLT